MTNPNNVRLDLYAPIHKGLRAFMTDVLLSVGRMDPLDNDELVETIGNLQLMLDGCRSHLFLENQFVHPAMEARKPGSACPTASEHVEQEIAFERLEAQIRLVEHGPREDRPANALQLYRLLALFVAENFLHMQVEETENNAVLWQCYTDQELLALHAQLLAAIPPHKMMMFLRWIIPSLTPAERGGMLMGMRADLPEPVFERILESVRSLVSPAAWKKLAALLETAAVA